MIPAEKKPTCMHLTTIETRISLCIQRNSNASKTERSFVHVFVKCQKLPNFGCDGRRE
jgi:hypothetical protein